MIANDYINRKPHKSKKYKIAHRHRRTMIDQPIDNFNKLDENISRENMPEIHNMKALASNKELFTSTYNNAYVSFIEAIKLLDNLVKSKDDRYADLKQLLSYLQTTNLIHNLDWYDASNKSSIHDITVFFYIDKHYIREILFNRQVVFKQISYSSVLTTFFKNILKYFQDINSKFANLCSISEESSLNNDKVSSHDTNFSIHNIEANFNNEIENVDILKANCKNIHTFIGEVIKIILLEIETRDYV